MQNLVKIGKELRTLSFDNRSVDRHTHTHGQTETKVIRLSIKMHLIDNHFGFCLSVCLLVCVRVVRVWPLNDCGVWVGWTGRVQ